jgi:hypothetical protein
MRYEHGCLELKGFMIIWVDRVVSKITCCPSLLYYWPNVTHGPAHFLRARSARHLQYMNQWRTHARQMQLWRANVTHMLYECHVDATGMSRECCADVVRIPRRNPAYTVRMTRASYARHSSSKFDVKRRVALDVRSALHSMGYFWSVLYVGLVTAR